MWGGIFSFMKKQNLNYTENFFNVEDSSSLGWLKIVLSCVLLRPIRLVNEIGKKIIFIGKDSLLYVLRVSVILNLFLLISNLLESFILKQEQRAYIPTSVLCSSLIILCVFYWRIFLLQEYNFKVVASKASFSVKAKDSDIFEVNPDDIKGEVAFEDVNTADVSFDDPINIFIEEPEQLETLGIDPAVYFDAEESRLLNAIEKDTTILDNESMVFTDVLEDGNFDKEDIQIAGIMEELQKQLQFN